MKNLKNWKVGAKLAISFGLVLLLLATIAALSVSQMSELNANTERIVKVEALKVKYANLALDNIRGSIARVFELTDVTEEKEVKVAVERLAHNTAAFNEALAKLEPMLHRPESKAIIAKAKDA